jgi:serine protease Do
MKKIMLGMSLLVIMQCTLNAQEVVIRKDSKDTTKPMVVVDGVVTDQSKLNSMSPNDIQSVNVLKGKLAKDKYGEQGSNGVIEITSKKKAKAGKLESTENMTVVINGDQVTINGVPADKNDPRIIRRGKVIITKGDKGGETIIINSDSGRSNNIELEEIELGAEDMIAPPPPPPPPPMNPAFLGVMTEAAENTKGAIINSVSDASPAQKAGLKEKDIITKLNDKIIDGPNTLYEAVGEFKPEEKVNITYLREGKEKKTTAVLEKNKNVASNNNIYFNAPNGMMPNNLRRGFKISPDQDFNFEMPELRSLDGLTGQFNRKPKLGISIEDLETGEGVKVKSVNDASPAEKAGFKANDIIVMFDDKKVTDVSDLKWEFIKEGQTLKFTVQRGGESKNIEVKIPKKLKTADL